MKSILVTIMKCILVSFFIAMATSSSCLAQVEQSITVQLGAPSTCTFNALSLMDGFTRPVTFGSAGTGAGTIVASPIVIVKDPDKCSIPLLLQLFKGTAMPTVVITLNGLVSGKLEPVLVITLTNAFVTAVGDADANATVPSEKVTMAYETIKITDPTNGNATVTCNLVTQVCN